ncbi:hypothetical protein N8I77_005425 [Diaporthe amygdali]|uniref:Uncharacterized protein n=1 Tax=Phomopsis amygdali TaxID=1214568 RepID=A0AAD9SFN7_PHOAM|nr:hypothetical protein N8I77_005425 [Diaporthe amygdali]
MNYTTAHNREQILESADEDYEDCEQAIKIVCSMLSHTLIAETASFMTLASRKLYPVAMRGNPATPAATSLREYHFIVLMVKLASSHADGRAQDFADNRFAVHNLLLEERKHEHLAEHFRMLMGLWVKEAWDKQREEDMEKQQRHAWEKKTKKLQEERERKRHEAENSDQDNDSDINSDSDDTATQESHSPASPAVQIDGEDDDEIVAPNLFALMASRENDTYEDEETASEKDKTSSDEMEMSSDEETSLDEEMFGE